MDSGTELKFYALRVLPQYEFMVMKHLRYQGIKAHVKTEKRLRRKTAKDKVRKEQTFIAASGYCFVGLPASNPNPWSLVHRIHMIRSVVSLNGRPAELCPDRLMDFLGYDDFSAPAHFKFLRTKGEQFQIGDVLKIAKPAFEDLNLPLVELREGECIFHLTLFGKVTELRVDPDQCYKAA